MKHIKLLICLAFIVFSCANDDTIVVVECTAPASFSVNNSTTTTATISWLSNNNGISYSIEYGLSGFTLGNGTMTDSDIPSIVLAGLNASTTYDIYVKAICSVSNESMFSIVFSFSTSADPVVAEFLPNLSDLNLFSGDLSNLLPNPNAFEYKLVTPLFTDYAHKLRFMALPQGQSMIYDGEGFPIFPEGTLLAKTFYYNYNELDLSAGRKIIETRILIRENNSWNIGNYVWNDDQTDAALDPSGHLIPISWINEQGQNMSTEYQVPVNSDCLACHSNSGETTIIGPKTRTMNFEVNGENQLETFMENGHLIGAPPVTQITALPNWEDTSFSLEERSRAYFDVNCAHCHSVGGYCETQSPLRLTYETPLNQSNIVERQNQILARMENYVEGFSMPFIGTTLAHSEGFDLIQEYINSLE
jgi:uncharacterized repeat protein (TIGR03806 family)